MNLQKTIADAIQTPSARQAVHDLVVLFHKIALAYLKGKASSGSLAPSRFALRIEDLALDCIADLFHHNETGQLDQIASYYRHIRYEHLTDDELLGATRRLVFGKVNQDLYRQYAEIDPALHRILRLIKNHAAKSRKVKVRQRNGESWVMFRESSNALPFMPPEILEAELLNAAQQSASIGGILDSVSSVLRDQETYIAGYPLIPLAQILRSVFAHLAESEQPDAPSTDSLSSEELRRVLAKCIKNVAARKAGRYITAQSVEKTVYDAYFRAIQDIWISRYLPEGKAMESFYHSLKAHLPHLTTDEYRQTHRTRFEYLALLTHEEFLRKIKREF